MLPFLFVSVLRAGALRVDIGAVGGAHPVTQQRAAQYGPPLSLPAFLTVRSALGPTRTGRVLSGVSAVVLPAGSPPYFRRDGKVLCAPFSCVDA